MEAIANKIQCEISHLIGSHSVGEPCHGFWVFRLYNEREKERHSYSLIEGRVSPSE